MKIETLGNHLQALSLKSWTVILFLLGLFTRLLALVIHGSLHTLISDCEPVQIALSLIHNGTYANAFGRGSGPSAHIGPMLPLVMAAVFQIFGSGTRGAFVISILASIASSLGYALLPALASVSGLGMLPGLVAGVIGALIPVTFWVQTSGVFDAPFTALFLIAICFVVSRCWIQKSFTNRDGVVIGTLGGVAGLFNAAVLQVFIAWFAIGIWRVRHRLREFLPSFLMAAICFMLVFAPWVIRNYLVFGKLILTRSGFGMNLQLSNNDYATGDMEKNVRSSYFIAMEPLTSEEERKKVKVMGEPAYNEAKLNQAVEWIVKHPSAFARLTLQRMELFWFPHTLRLWQTCMETVFAIFGLGGVLSLIRSRHPAALPFGALLCYGCLFSIIEVSPRYRYPIEPLLMMLGAYWVVKLCSIRIGSRSGTVPFQKQSR